MRWRAVPGEAVIGTIRRPRACATGAGHDLARSAARRRTRRLWILSPRFTIFSADVTICSISLWPGRNACRRFSTRSRRRATSSISSPTSRQNLVGRLAHAGVLADLLHHLDRQHQQRRRHDDDRAVAPSATHRRSCRAARHRRNSDGTNISADVLRLARDQIFLGDIGDVLADVGRTARDRLLALFVGLGFAQRGHSLERKLGVDDQRRGCRAEDARNPAATCSTA